MTESIFSPSTPPDPDTYIFRTTNHAFVAAAIANDLFEYVGCEMRGATAVLKLADPDHLCEAYQKRFATGIFPKVNPFLHNAARGFLREEMKNCQAVTRG